jgi:uncharacterized protein (DUF305 family)
VNDGYRFKPMRKAAVPILIFLVATTFVVFRREVLRDIWLRLNEVPLDSSSMMDGMLTLEDLDALGQLKGADFDAAWAKAMIAHHEGAITMANDVLADGKNSEILALANAVISGQTAEIEILKPLAG